MAATRSAIRVRHHVHPRETHDRKLPQGRPRLPPTLDPEHHKLEPALRDPVDRDARHGSHLPDLGTADVSDALLDRLRPNRTAKTAGV